MFGHESSCFFFFTSSWQRLRASPILKLVTIEDDVESPWESCIYICSLSAPSGSQSELLTPDTSKAVGAKM